MYKMYCVEHIIEGYDVSGHYKWYSSSGLLWCVVDLRNVKNLSVGVFFYVKLTMFYVVTF